MAQQKMVNGVNVDELFNTITRSAPVTVGLDK